jgi:hypothetical protein
MSDFYRTKMGQTFLCKTMPELVKQLARLNDNLERILADKAPEAAPELTALELDNIIVTRTHRSPVTILDMLDMDCLRPFDLGCECDRCAYANDHELMALLELWQKAKKRTT